ETRSMRSKEEANDYRYFPDPDLLPVVIDEAYVEAIRKELPELPEQKKQRYIKDFELSSYDADVITSSRELADYFETVQAKCGDAKLAANWVTGELAARLNKEEIEITDVKVGAEAYAELLLRIKDNTISGKIAKDVFEAMWNGEGSADEVIESKGLKQITDSSAIEAMVDEVIANNPSQFEELKGGKDKMMSFFVGQVMKASKGKANPGQVNEIMRKRLSE
ncbi:MAG: Asp-tRNA(Asn)/Glu-tRNA(Gln) amidotransferase GatCAB subunit B, partial [Gammaproteobacteria bacterium]|nr:Asp-tRNA(Asn)/Glu-tRNA(Gln) amidotransferase GatCAB subunit B [Gammaproteobacteria bacterium]